MTTHDRFTERLSEYLDGDLAPADRTALERHLASCELCRTTLVELREVVERAKVLGDTAPPVDLWAGVAHRIGPRRTDVDRSGRPAPRRFSVTFSFTLPQLAAAMLAITLLSAGMIWMARLGGTRTDFPPLDARAQRTGQDAEPQIRPADFADAAYDEAIADLQQALEAERTRLDAGTMRVLKENLAAIDHAIEECRTALASDPANAYLNSHLAAAKRRKLTLLRRASALAQRES